MSPRRNWDSPNPSLASECAHPPPARTWGGGGEGTLAAGDGLWPCGSPNIDDLRKKAFHSNYSVPKTL
jgi:hypothetical protein